MGFQQCSSCKGYYNASRGGCINPECSACDKARVANISSTPVVPRPKPKKMPAVEKPPWANKKARCIGGIGAPPKEGGPSPVAVPESDAMSEPEDHQSDTGYHVIYRGDTRTPAQLESYGGFTAWVPLSDEQARDVVKRS
jgi:hypothetical protein